MPLTDTAIKKAKPEAKHRKLYDERGLFLLISPKGGKWWRFKYLFDGKEKLLSLGTYPDVSLKDARERRDEARKQVAAGIDPGEHQLSHAVRDPNGRAYNRTAHLPERRKMMQEWADYLDKLKAGAEIISINRSA
jgi:hypothetical protein